MLVIPDGLPKEELDVCPYERKKLEARELRSIKEKAFFLHQGRKAQ